MLLTIATTHKPATDLGFLLHKNPARSQSLDLAFGQAYMFYPEAGDTRCTFTLLLDLNPVELVRGSEKGGSGLLDQYVNDRPYAASSFLSVAMARCLRTALGGRCEQLPELAGQAIPLEAMVTPLPVRGEPELVTRLFAPLGYDIAVDPVALDAAHTEWGASPYVTLRLTATCRLADLLNHLYVLIPVLDLKKHYLIQGEEIDKLIAKGGAWLQSHPERDLIARRYLKRKRAFANLAIAHFAEMDGLALADEEAEAASEAALAADPDSIAPHTGPILCGGPKRRRSIARPLIFEPSSCCSVIQSLKAQCAIWVSRLMMRSASQSRSSFEEIGTARPPAMKGCHLIAFAMSRSLGGAKSSPWGGTYLALTADARQSPGELLERANTCLWGDRRPANLQLQTRAARY